MWACGTTPFAVVLGGCLAPPHSRPCNTPLHGSPFCGVQAALGLGLAVFLCQSRVPSGSVAAAAAGSLPKPAAIFLGGTVLVALLYKAAQPLLKPFLDRCASH